MKAQILFIFLISLNIWSDEIDHFENDYVWAIQTPKESKVLVLPHYVPQTKTVFGDSYIFDTKLTRDIKQRYKEEFGYLPDEYIEGVPDKQNIFSVSNKSDYLVQQDKELKFGIYMGKRVAEYHIESYFKSKPSLKKVWDLKERLSNVEVEVSPGYKFKTGYSFSANDISAQFLNPYLDVSYRLKMDQNKIGPSRDIEESSIWLERKITKKVKVNGQYRIEAREYTLILLKDFTESLTGSVKAAVDQDEVTSNVETYLAALMYAF